MSIFVRACFLSETSPRGTAATATSAASLPQIMASENTERRKKKKFTKISYFRIYHEQILCKRLVAVRAQYDAASQNRETEQPR